jgi:cystathionine beta-synthase
VSPLLGGSIPGVLHVQAKGASCEDGEFAACHIHQQDWGIPIVVTPGRPHRGDPDALGKYDLGAFSCDRLALMRIANSVVDLIGLTPLVRLNSVTRGVTSATVLAKVEYMNPGGSSKDRIAIGLVDAAEKAGHLKPGGTIVEPTSGNTGVGLALVAQQRGYKCVFVCPDKVSEDKRRVLQAYGAEVVVTPTNVEPEDPESYYSVSDRLAREIPGAFKPNQYANPAGPEAHFKTTGPEIWEDTEGPSPTLLPAWEPGEPSPELAATSKKYPRVGQVIGADPEGSIYAGGDARPYFVEGVGEDFWPAAYDPSFLTGLYGH